MEFSLDEFICSPSWEKLLKCKKADLLIVANCCNVGVSYSLRKTGLRHALCEKLVEKGVLPALAAAADEAEAAAPATDARVTEVVDVFAAGVEHEPAHIPPVGNMSIEDLRLALCIKEVPNKELEVQAMHLRVKALELECGAPVVSTPRSVNQSALSASAGFDISKHIVLVPRFVSPKLTPISVHLSA